ncbi:MAG: tRNA pseudouridine(55) synthase TruB [Dehalococcoidia bacterium]|nr:tRNA pseudouridine(55) synthase TruB [Dehalococcoidia bacterium]
MNGILNINKTSGPTSFAVVACVRRLTGVSKVGHGGTLDPLASGVLPIFLGQATRLSEYLMQYHKTYRARIMLGVTTDSYDVEGAVTGRGDFSAVTREVVERAIEHFRGEISQTPPEYSALKYKGQPLYKLAREGRKVELQSRLVSIYRLELLSFAPPVLDLEIECSKGTYIRSLAHELGQALGCGGHIVGLIRTSYGPFDIKQAISLDELEASVAEKNWERLVQPMDSVLSLWPQLGLSDAQTQAVRCGEALVLQMPPETSCLRAYDADGHFVAILEYDPAAAMWHPKKVFQSCA